MHTENDSLVSQNFSEKNSKMTILESGEILLYMGELYKEQVVPIQFIKDEKVCNTRRVQGFHIYLTLYLFAL